MSKHGRLRFVSEISCKSQGASHSGKKTSTIATHNQEGVSDEGRLYSRDRESHLSA